MKAVKIWVPATIANFGPGFDVFGISLNAPSDIVEVKESEFISLTVEGHEVPKTPQKNVAWVAAWTLLQKIGKKISFHMKIRKGIKPGGGLGSSGASSLGGAMAMAKLLGVEDQELILQAALEGERIASGFPHGDNVVPAYFGGFTILNSVKPLDVIKIDVCLDVVVIVPEIKIKTKEAREILPKRVLLKHAVRNLSFASSVAVCLLRKDLKSLAKYMKDFLVFPYRKKLYPWFDRIRDVALNAGAYELFVSGSGPAVFAFGENLSTVGEKVKEEFLKMGIKSKTFVTKTGGRAKCI